MTYLETILKEESDIMDKLTKAMEAIEEWFELKMKQATDIFENAKEKVKDKLAEKGLIKKAEKDVVHKGEVILKKGQDIGLAAKNQLSKLGKACSGVIKNCKDGLKALTKKDSETVAKMKKATTAGMAIVGEILTKAIIIVGVNVTAKAISEKISERIK